MADRLREAFEAARTAPPKAADQIHLGELTPEVVAKVNQALKDAGSAADVSGYSHQVDAYAARQAPAQALISALVKLYRDNASTLTPDPLYSSIYDSHPPAAIRIARLQEAAQ